MNTGHVPIRRDAGCAELLTKASLTLDDVAKQVAIEVSAGTYDAHGRHRLMRIYLAYNIRRMEWFTWGADVRRYGLKTETRMRGRHEQPPQLRNHFKKLLARRSYTRNSRHCIKSGLRAQQPSSRGPRC